MSVEETTYRVGVFECGITPNDGNIGRGEGCEHYERMILLTRSEMCLTKYYVRSML